MAQPPKQPKRGIVLGQILQSYPPFTLRQQIAQGPEAFHPRILSDPAITISFRGEAYPIASTDYSHTELSWVIYALREWLADRPRIIRSWEDHLDRLQRPEEMARLAADLEAEREAEEAQEAQEEDSSAEDESDAPRAPRTAERVLANQRDELERIRQLTHDVEQGLQTLEAAHPEAVAALNEVADEMVRVATEGKRRVSEYERLRGHGTRINDDQ